MPVKSSDKTLASLYTSDAHPWRYRSDNMLKHVIRTQHDAAMRNMRPLWFWRFDKDEAAVTSVFRETGHLKKRYQGPVAALLKFNQGTQKKPLTRAMVDVELPSTVTIDFAECIHLGEFFDVEDPGLPYKFYIPCTNDVIQWDNSLFVISDMATKNYFAPVARYVVWQGPVTLLRGDSADPLRPIERRPKNPEWETPQWLS